VPAAGPADVGAGYSQPLELLGSRQHPLQQLAVADLDLPPLAQGPPRRRDSRHQSVADRLQIAEAEDMRLAPGGWHRGVEIEPRERLRHQAG